ncbi:MAG: hypothetical protein AAFR84_20700 [Pseudomonadota bacterium]
MSSVATTTAAIADVRIASTAAYPEAFLLRLARHAQADDEKEHARCHRSA